MHKSKLFYIGPKIIRSIFSPKYLEEFVKYNYPQLNNCTISLLQIGDNDHYLIRSIENDYVLRIYRHKKHWLLKESDYLFEIELLNFLKETTVNVCYPLQRYDGNYIGIINAPEGIRYSAVFTCAKGQSMRLNKKDCYMYGEHIAKFHLETNNFQSQYVKNIIGSKFLIDLPIKRLVSVLAKNRDNDVELLLSIQEKINQKIKMYTNSLSHNSWGIIGGDFHGYNHLCLPSGEITSFDYDLCGYGWRVYDLATFKWSLTLLHPHTPNKRQEFLWKSFLKGYQDKRFLNSSDINMVNLFMIVRQIWLMGSEVTYKDYVLNKSYWDLMFKRLKLLIKIM